MQDVLKLAEEALVNLHSFAQPHNRMTDEPWAWMEREYAEALAALRSARAELGWRPIAEMEEKYTDAVPCGVWTFSTSGKWTWTIDEQVHTKRYAELACYTHFYLPQLPPPPTREEVGNVR